MGSTPDQSPPSRGTLALIFLVALPLMALVAAILVYSASLKDQPRHLPAIVEPANGPTASKAVTAANEEHVSKEIPSPSTPTSPPVAAKSPPSSDSAPSAIAPPWQAALDLAGEPPSYTSVAFLPFEEAFDHPHRDDLAPWFEKTPAAGFRVNKIPSQYGKSGTIEGIGRLRCPWPDDGVLRLQLENFNRLKMHFFSGQSGASLIYYEDQGNRWAAYGTTRSEGQPTPASWAITSTDDDRCRRSELRFGGPIELRYRDYEIILSRGDVVLLTAPLPGPPSDVFFEGRATIHGIELARTKDAPVAPPAAKIVKNIERPADLAWTATQLEMAKPESLTGGSLQFSGANLKSISRCNTPLPATSLNEIIFELSDVSQGAGLYLGSADAAASDILWFCRDRKSGQLAARIGNGDEKWEDDFDSPADKPTPFVQPHCWVRLLRGCGNLRWWLSTDGIHWAQTEPAREHISSVNESIGLALAANCPAAKVTLKRIIVRPLAGLSSFVKSELVDQVSPTTAKSLAEWLLMATNQKPSEIESSQWLRACSIRSLAGGAPRELAYVLLESLLDDAAQRDLSLDEQLAALDDAMLLALDLRDRSAMRVGMLSRYVQLGLVAANKHGLPAWSSVRAHYHAAPAVTTLQMPTDLSGAIRWELLCSAYLSNARESSDFVARLRFFHQLRDPAVRGLADWVEWLVSKSGSDRTTASLARLKDSWREPLVEELSKDTYNSLTELKAVVDSESWDDAARLVASFTPQAASGVAPYGDDRELLVSLRTAIQLAMEDYPLVRQALGEKFTALARLRIAQAIAAGDAATVELATAQFAGTPAAAEAHRWLGDRALAAGHFARAITEYDQALGNRSGPDEEFMPRVRLAAAMLGRDSGTPPAKALEFGDMSMSPAEFESLIAEIRGRASSSASAGSLTASVPPPSGFGAQLRGRLDGPGGERPQEDVGRRTNQLRVPWVDRQIATAIDGDVMYVSNRFHVAAYNLTTGERLWQSQSPPGQMQRAQEWATVAMRPLVVGDRIFVRLLYSGGPLLACLEKSTGELLWAAENRDREFFASDPMLIDGQLVALGISIEPDHEGMLRFFSLDPQTGETLRQRDLVRLRGTWSARGCCEATPHENGLAVALGGVVLGLDMSGNVRWVRSQLTIPADDDPRGILQMHQPPLVRNGRLYVAQPGVRTVQCLSAETGRSYWSAVLPEIVGIVGLAENLLVVRTEGGVCGLDLTDGNARWKYDAADLFSFQLVDDQRLLIAHREVALGNSESREIHFTWLNPADGEPTATALLPGLTDSDPRLGPIVTNKDRLFTFFGRGQHDSTRDIVELAPRGEAEPVLPRPNAWQESLSTMQKH